MQTVMGNFDGPLYIVIAKTWYDFSQGNKFEFPLTDEYYAAHFPLYPGLIKLGSPMFTYPGAMLIVTLLGSVAAGVAFYYLAKEFMSEGNAFALALIFLFFPARYLVVRSIGSPEPWFLFFIIMSVKGFTEKKYWQAGLFGMLATMTKSPGILLLVSYLVYMAWTKVDLARRLRAYIPLILIPAALLTVFGLYRLQYGDFWAYFHSGDNIHLEVLPFGVFNAGKDWVGSFWLEDVIWVYLMGLMGLFRLISQKRYEMASFVGVFLATILFVSHRDVSRYALPIVPFVLIAFADVLVKKEYRWVYWIILLPIFLYSVNFIANNSMQIADWGKLL